ncbi:TPA: hypothetical protein I8287_004826 [Kluyvera intermedia]|nr:hypothetical protein [Kluyvera intermedia]
MSIDADVLYRTIKQSPDIIEGLKTGMYKIYGGVIRVAKGHEKAGSIVAHLMFPSDAEKAQESIESLKNVLSSQMGTIQSGIETLQGSVNTLQMLQSANLALSGLNLAVSVAGFAIVCHKLNRIESLLHTQSQKLDTLLHLALDARQRESFRDIASFNAALNTARQFAEMGDTAQLKSLVHNLNAQYEFTSLALKNTANAVNSAEFYPSLHELNILQERFMYLGLFRSFIQQKIGAPRYALESLEQLNADWLEINTTIVDGISHSPATLQHLSRQDGDNLLSFLNYRKTRIEAIEYQSNLLRLAIEKPEILEFINASNDEILVLAA